jgi:hypothetical protein
MNNPGHLVIGSDAHPTMLQTLYTKIFPGVHISTSSTTMTEMMKISCNTFYAHKVQAFNEIAGVCDAVEVSYPRLRQLMLMNNWINPQHTDVPGPDGLRSYGGMCFTKDLSAFNGFMDTLSVPHACFDATKNEQKIQRPTEHLIGDPQFPFMYVTLVDCAPSIYERARKVKGWNVTVAATAAAAAAVAADGFDDGQCTDVIIHGNGGNEENRIDWDSLMRVFLLRKTCPCHWLLSPRTVDDSKDQMTWFGSDGYRVSDATCDRLTSVEFLSEFPAIAPMNDRRTVVVF